MIYTNANVQTKLWRREAETRVINTNIPSVWNYRVNEEKTRYGRSAKVPCGGARGAAFSVVLLQNDIKSASRWNTSAFGEQPSRPHHLCAHGFFHCLVCCLCWPISLGIVTDTITYMIRSLLIVKESNAFADGIMSRSLVLLFVILRRSFDCAL